MSPSATRIAYFAALIGAVLLCAGVESRRLSGREGEDFFSRPGEKDVVIEPTSGRELQQFFVDLNSTASSSSSALAFSTGRGRADSMGDSIAETLGPGNVNTETTTSASSETFDPNSAAGALGDASANADQQARVIPAFLVQPNPAGGFNFGQFLG